jgi:hypothetical protein
VWDAVQGSTLAAGLVESLAAVLPDDPPTFPVRVPYGYGDTDRISADVHAGGLLLDGMDRLVLRGQPITAAAFADGFCRGTPLRFALEERGSLDDLAQALAEDLTARLGPAPIEGELTGFVVTASSPGTSAGS